MFIIGNQGVCPKGYICVNNYNVLMVLLVIISIIYFFNKQIYLSLYNKMLEQRQNTYQKVVSNPPAVHINNDTQDGYSYNTQQKGAIIEQPFNNPTRMSNSNNVKQNHYVDVDRLLLNDPLYPPLSRNYHEDPTTIVGQHNIGERRRGISINIETRGSGGDFQQVGILSKTLIEKEDSTPGNNTDVNVLPLYGKPTYKGSNRWLYYTETDKYNPIKIPINVNSKDCTDDTGCDELYNGSEVTIPSYNGLFKVKIYKFNKPRYIPLDNPREILPLPFT